MTTLLIDTSNQPLAVGLVQDGRTVINYQSNVKKNHSLQLMPVIEQMMDDAKISPQQLTEVVVADGPGSYTGLRIGITTAKTMAYTLNIPLYTVSSLKALAKTCAVEDALIVPIIDARREHVFSGVYQYENGQLITVMEDQYISIEQLNTFLSKHNKKLIYIGNDAKKLETYFTGDILPNLPNASLMFDLKTNKVENIHDVQPMYLKLSEAEQNWKNQQTKH